MCVSASKAKRNKTQNPNAISERQTKDLQQSLLRGREAKRHLLSEHWERLHGGAVSAGCTAGAGTGAAVGAGDGAGVGAGGGAGAGGAAAARCLATAAALHEKATTAGDVPPLPFEGP